MHKPSGSLMSIGLPTYARPDPAIHNSTEAPQEHVPCADWAHPCTARGIDSDGRAACGPNCRKDFFS